MNEKLMEQHDKNDVEYDLEEDFSEEDYDLDVNGDDNSQDDEDFSGMQGQQDFFKQMHKNFLIQQHQQLLSSLSDEELLALRAEALKNGEPDPLMALESYMMM